MKAVKKYLLNIKKHKILDGCQLWPKIVQQIRSQYQMNGFAVFSRSSNLPEQKELNYNICVCDRLIIFTQMATI